MGTPIGEALAKTKIELSSLNGRTVGIDAFNVLYQFLSSIRGDDGNPLMDSKGRITSHLSGLYYRTANWMMLGIRPVYVFDGPPHALKERTREMRREIRDTAVSELKAAQESEDVEQIQKTKGAAVKLTSEIIEDAKQLVQLMGVPVVQARSEGEAQLAAMVSKGDLYAGISQDYDSLLFGMPRLVRNAALSGKRKVPGKNYSITIEPETIELEASLAKSRLTRKQLIWLGMLLGTDFNPKVPRVGVKTGLKKVAEAKSVNELFGSFEYAEAFDYAEVEQLFLNPPFNPDYRLDLQSPDPNGLLHFLVDEHDFSLDRVKATLDKLLRETKEKKSQTSLGAWS